MVVGAVLAAVFVEGCVDLGLEFGYASAGRPGNKERADLGADEVVRATGAEEGEVFGLGRVDKLKHVGRVGEARDPAIAGADAAAEGGSDLDGQLATFGAGGKEFAAEAGGAFGPGVDLDELADVVDDGEGVCIALALGLAPGEEAVAAENDAVAGGVGEDCGAQHQAEFEAGTLPGQPDQGVAEGAVELFHFGFAVGRGGQGNSPVGVKVVDVGKGQKAVQGGVDGGGDRVVAEGAERVQGHHFIFKIDALVAALKGEELVLIEGGEAGALHAAQIAAGTLDPQDFNGLAGEGIDFSDFGTGVAAGEVGDAQIGAEQVGAIEEQLRLVEGVGDGGVPAVFEELEGEGSGSCQSHRHQCKGNWTDSVKIAQRKQ